MMLYQFLNHDLDHKAKPKSIQIMFQCQHYYIIGKHMDLKQHLPFCKYAPTSAIVSICLAPLNPFSLPDKQWQFNGNILNASGPIYGSGRDSMCL